MVAAERPDMETIRRYMGWVVPARRQRGIKWYCTPAGAARGSLEPMEPRS